MSEVNFNGSNEMHPLRKKYPMPLSPEDQALLERRDLYEYVMAMVFRLSDDNPLLLSVVQDDGSRKAVGFVAGGLSFGTGESEVLGVSIPVEAAVLAVVASVRESIKELVPIVRTKSNEAIPEGVPDLRGRTLLLHTKNFCLKMEDVVDYEVGEVHASSEVAMYGPVMVASKSLTSDDLSVYSCIDTPELLAIAKDAPEEPEDEKPLIIM